MKPRISILLAMVAVLFAACSTPRMATSTEYDDIYYNSSDETASVTYEDQDRQNTNEDSYYRENTANGYQSYSDADYDEDDFHYSRRLRRFGSNSSNSWRYYDPYYSNDIYYVMGTPAWSRWNNNGWYNWNRPRFGASISYGSPFFNSGFGSPYGSFNSFNYYNPWVNTYYGYNAGFGYSPFGFAPSYGYNNFGYGGYYGGFGAGSAYYCPPGVYGNGGYASSLPAYQRYTTRHRNSTRTSSSQSTYAPSTTRVREQRMTSPGTVGAPTNTVTNSGTTRSNRYLSPRPQSELVQARNNSTNYTRPSTTRPTTRDTRATTPTYNRPNRTTTTTQERNSTRPNVYTRPGRTTTTTQERNNGGTRPNTYTRPSRSNTERATPSQPNRRNYSSPTPTRRSNSGSERRNYTPTRRSTSTPSAPSRSYSAPSRSSSPARSSGSSNYTPPSRSSSPSSGSSSSGSSRRRN